MGARVEQDEPGLKAGVTRRASADPLTLFILAHPDDEIAFAPILHRLAVDRASVRLIYLTDGVAGAASAATRRAETRAALASLGIDPGAAGFTAIADGRLIDHLDDALAALDRLLAPDRPVAAIYTLAWEGGHPDHDAAHVVAVAFAQARGLADRLFQLPFYRAPDRLPAPLFVVAAALAANGPALPFALTAAERWLGPALMRYYRSQWRSFAGLGPLILWRSLTRRGLPLQRVEPGRPIQRPTARPLLYEVRNGVRFEDFAAAARSFLARQAPSSAPAARDKVHGQ